MDTSFLIDSEKERKFLSHKIKFLSHNGRRSNFITFDGGDSSNPHYVTTLSAMTDGKHV
jgi:hypothetical protein